MTVQAKRFRIETHPNCGNVLPAAAPVNGSARAVDDDVAEFRHQELLGAIREMQRLAEVTPKEAVTDHILDDYKHQIAEVRKLKVELDGMYDAITRTKKEIATLHANSFQETNMSRATDQLDAVVGGTEQATTAILGAAEEIDQFAAMLQHKLSQAEDVALAEDIQHQIIKIFEACNFQDLTGQRITKVVNTLRFIEQRIVRMMDVWGGLDAFRDIEPEPMERPTGHKELLNGPALDDEPDRSSQADIDALFG